MLPVNVLSRSQRDNTLSHCSLATGLLFVISICPQPSLNHKYSPASHACECGTQNIIWSLLEKDPVVLQNTGQLAKTRFGHSNWPLGHSWCQLKWLSLLIHRNRSDWDGGRSFLYTSLPLLKGCPGLVKGMVSGHPSPPCHPSCNPYPLCQTPSPSLLTQGENYFELGEYSSIEMERGLHKRGWSLKNCLSFLWGALHHWKAQDDRSTEGTRSLDWHLRKLFIPLCLSKSSPKDLHEKCPQSTPHWAQSLPLCLPLSVCFQHKKAFLQISIQSLSCAQNQTTLFCCLCSGMDCRQLLTSSCNKTSAQKSWEPPTFGRCDAPPRAVWGAPQCICWRPCIPGERLGKPKSNNGLNVQMLTLNVC